MSTEPLVWVFFYGTFINPDVCAGAGATLRDVEVARLAGFDVRIGPLANLVHAEQHTAYGIVARMTHAELGKLYTMEWVGTYLPEAVVVHTRGERLLPALTYLKPDMQIAPPADDYVDRIVGPARQYGFPAWYVERLESFRAGAGTGQG